MFVITIISTLKLESEDSNRVNTNYITFHNRKPELTSADNITALVSYVSTIVYRIIIILVGRGNV